MASLVLYNIGIRFYAAFIGIAAIFKPKAKAFLEGRYDLFGKLEVFRNTCLDAELIWVHCASLGEFEQGRPVIEGLKVKWPEKKIALTFFSPSGYEIRKDYEYADFVTYLPLDTKGNARQFIEILQPDFVIFVKYEYWYHHLSVLHQKGIPHILVSAIFSPNQIFFKWYGGLFRKLLKQYDQLFVQDEVSETLLKGLGVQKCQQVGDTRVDRVAQIAISSPEFQKVEGFVDGKKVFIAGSTWPPGEDVLCSFFNGNLPPDWKIIIAPHEVSSAHIKQLERKFTLSTIKYSALQQESRGDWQVLIIDNIGLLASLYRYGKVAYIGGGFGVGIHNILEPATFGLPVIFGLNHELFREAVTLKKKGGAFVIQNQVDLQNIFDRLSQKENYDLAASASLGYIDKNRGATEKILTFVDEYYTSKSREL